MEEYYPGNPSEKFIEEKIKLNKIISNIHKIEDAIPIIHKMFKEQQKQSDIILAHKMQMQDFLTINSIEAKFSNMKVDLESAMLKRLKNFQVQFSELIQSKVDKEEYLTHTKSLPNTINDLRFGILKKLDHLENDKLVSLRKMLTAKIQEVDLLVHTKANDAEVQIIKQNKVGEEEIEAVNQEIKHIKGVISTLEGEENEFEQDSEHFSPRNRHESSSALSGEEYSLRHIFQEFMNKLEQDRNKKHLKHQQRLLIEAVKKILYDENRFDNMRKEILVQRDEVQILRKEKQDLEHKLIN